MKKDCSIEKQREHFESISNLYYTARKDHKHKHLKNCIWKYALQNIRFENKNTIHILEAMCGCAESYDIIRHHLTQNICYDAMDYSSFMVEEANKRFEQIRKSNPTDNFSIWKQDVTTFLPEKKYDLIILIGGLHHVYNKSSQVVSLLCDSLNSCGYFISFEPTHNNKLMKTIRNLIYKKNKLFDEQTEHGFSTTELNSLFIKNDMKIYYQFYPGLLTYNLWYNPDAFPLLNIGSLEFAKKTINIEKKIWCSRFARYFSFTTFTIYKKL